MEIQGIIVPVLTPMWADESICEEELRREVDRMIQAGVHGIFPCGTNGEGYILSAEEKLRVIQVCVEQARGRVPVYAGTGCVSTGETVALSQRAEEIGADALSVITPSFAAASQEELVTHYRQVAASVHLPIVLYNIPMRTGNMLQPATVEKLSQVENIRAVKDSSGSFNNILQYIALTRQRKDFSVLSGNDALILWTVLAGGRGGVSGCANVFPRNMVSIYEYAVTGNWTKAQQAQENIRPFRECFRFGNPNTIVKTAARLMGHPVGPCRAPFNQLSAQGMEALERALQTMQEKGID
ncbi:MAG: 4-hydroxy-tetrahydrodipicolinate synthase [Clostridia bacterium]|nr:4-hydroxy-tetrahydrodipicolinate synthase [Clostridia bacterium]